LVRTPADETYRLALFRRDPDLNPIHLILYVTRLHGLGDDELDRLTYVELDRAGGFRLPDRRLSRTDQLRLVDVICGLDPRLRWQERPQDPGTD
jgi:hypothetical protein